MEPVFTARKVRLAATLLLIALPLSSGCFLRGKFTNPGKTEPAQTAVASQAVATWNGKVEYGPDPLKGGAVVPYLVGRMYLFGPDIKQSGTPLIGDGSLIVDLYDHTPRPGSSEPVMLQQHRFDPETLKKLAKEDLFGMGYTVYFPWLTYRPDITQVHLIMRFDQAKGAPLMHQSGTLTIDHSATKELQSLQAKGQGPPVAAVQATSATAAP
jgi:hypothetical protein